VMARRSHASRFCRLRAEILDGVRSAPEPSLSPP
jgi:hypothetical protein